MLTVLTRLLTRSSCPVNDLIGQGSRLNRFLRCCFSEVFEINSLTTTSVKLCVWPELIFSVFMESVSGREVFCLFVFLKERFPSSVLAVSQLSALWMFLVQFAVNFPLIYHALVSMSPPPPSSSFSPSPQWYRFDGFWFQSLKYRCL